MNINQGSLCQVLVANASEIAKKSTKLSFTEAAALPVAYITSLQSLRDYGNSVFFNLKGESSTRSNQVN